MKKTKSNRKNDGVEYLWRMFRRAWKAADERDRLKAMAKPPPPPLDMPTLTFRQFQLLTLLCAGRTATKELAADMKISTAGVKRHLEKLFDRLGVRDRAALTAWCFRHGQMASGRVATLSDAKKKAKVEP